MMIEVVKCSLSYDAAHRKQLIEQIAFIIIVKNNLTRKQDALPGR
jgi:hypothetical protein